MGELREREREPLAEARHETLRRNLARVRERIAAAAQRTGRPADSVQLVAVTKAASLAETQALVDLGADVLGENRVQAAQEKIPRIRGTVTWHMIGHLQRNKVRKALELMQMVESVDSLRLAEALNRVAGDQQRRLPILLEINTGGEAQKHGLPPAEAEPVLAAIRELPHLDVRGLMTMAPFTADEGPVRRCFAALRELRDRLQSAVGLVLPELSMGMTNDFEWGIAEGATIVRIGSALFADE